MPFIGALIGGVAGLAGASMSSRAARKAGEAQAASAEKASQAQLQAAREANMLQAAMFKNAAAQGAPYQQSGQVALSALMGGMGFGPARSSRTANSPYGSAPQKSIGYQPAGTYINAEGLAVDGQGNPITAGATDYGISDLNYGATQDELDAASKTIDSGYFTHNFDANDFKNNIDPGYQWRMDQGNAALAAKRAAVGNRFGGQALRDITNYNQDAASQEYQSAYDRYNKNKALIFDRLSTLSGYGTGAGNSAAAAGQTAGANIGSNTMSASRSASDYLTSAAASRAAGSVGSTNAIVGGLNTGLNNWYGYRMMGTPNSSAGTSSFRSDDPYRFRNYFGGDEGE